MEDGSDRESFVTLQSIFNEISGVFHAPNAFQFSDAKEIFGICANLFTCISRKWLCFDKRSTM